MGKARDLGLYHANWIKCLFCGQYKVYHWMNHHCYVCCNALCPYLKQNGYAWRELDFNGNTYTTADKFNADGTPVVTYRGLTPKIPAGMVFKGGKFFPKQIVNKYF